MLRFNSSAVAPSFATDSDFNTSYVKVQHEQPSRKKQAIQHFNTSYVKVQLRTESHRVFSEANFNTSYVKVQLTPAREVATG